MSETNEFINITRMRQVLIAVTYAEVQINIRAVRHVFSLSEITIKNLFRTKQKKRWNVKLE